VNYFTHVALFVLLLSASSLRGDDAQACIQEAYKDKNGYLIGDQESQFIVKEGGAPTYGEITYESARTLFNNLNVTDKDIFYDLGCGVGKLVVQACLTTPMKKCVGIELSSTRFEHAQQVRKDLVKKNKSLGKRIKFYKKNILNDCYDNATIIFLCSTCFSESLINALVQKFAALKKGVKIVSLKTLPAHESLKHKTDYYLDMTWSANVPVHIYEVV
jgi:precorrin-6B methylase 2